MAARYADAANIVAQGQSFYTGLLPGSYENTGGALKGNVYGKGSGGSANVTADRTGSEAAALSIGDYKAKAGPTPASILKAGEEPSDTDRIVAAIRRGPDGGGAAPLPNPGGRGGGQASGQGLGDLIPGGWPQHQGQNPFGQNPMGTGQKPQHQGGDPAADDGGPGLPERFGGDDPEAAEALMPQAERLKWAAAGLPNPPNAPGQQNPFGRDTLTAGKGMGALIPGAPAKSKSPRTRTPEQQAARTAKAREDRETVNKANAMGGIDTLVPAADLKFGMEEVTKSKGPTDYIKDSTMGQWSGSVQRRASTRAQTRQPGVQQSIPQQAIPSLSVSGAASTRSHTRQSGVQQSATHKSFLYPNMANSTNRALNF